MFKVATLAPILQALMTSTADDLARQARFIQRQGRLTGADFLQALTFGFLKRRQAPLEALALPRGISRQALDQRLDKPPAADFCKRALLQTVSHVLQARPALCPLLAPFRGVSLDDCTQAWMPDGAGDDFPGNGGSSPERGKARRKVLVRWEIQAGNLCHLGIHKGRPSDHDAEALAPPPPGGSLHLADRGFADFGRLQAESDQGVYFVTRLPAPPRLSPSGGNDRPLAEQLASWRREGIQEVDIDTGVGNQGRLEGRLVALACPADVVARRLANLEVDAKGRGRPVSARQREMCRWTVLLTNVPRGWLNGGQLGAVYRLRWQIELLFKRLKSEGGLGQTGSNKRYRVESEWYVKLRGQVIRNGVQLLRGGPRRDVNPVQLGRVIADNLHKLCDALRQGQGVAQALTQIEEELGKVRDRTDRRKRKTVARSFAQAVDEFVLAA